MDEETQNCLPLGPGEPQPLYLSNVVGESLPGEGVVVKIARHRTQRSDRERRPLRTATTGLLNVVGELDARRHREIDFSEVAPAAVAPARIGSRKTSAVSGKNELPIQPSASSPVSRGGCGR